MPLIEFATIFEDVAKGTKQWACEDGPTDIAATVLASRGDIPVALVTINRHNRDVILRVASCAAGGFDADQIGVAFETFIPREDPEHPELAHIDPRTGKTWAPGALGHAAANEDGIEQGLVREALMIVAVNRAGDIASINLPFHYINGRHLAFLPAERRVMDSSTGPEIVFGLMADTLLKAMSTKSMSQYIPPGPRLSRERRDALVATFLEGQGHVVHLIDDMQRTERLMKMGLNREDK